jgi:hypothetical protein
MRLINRLTCLMARVDFASAVMCIAFPDDVAAAGAGLRTTVSCHPNVFGGVDIWDGASQVGSTQPNVFGGFDRYQGSTMIDRTIPNVFGGVDHYSSTFGAGIPGGKPFGG